MDNTIHMAGPWITEFEEKIVLDAVRNGWYGKDAYSYVEKFEHEFSKFHERKFGLMTPNCTTAIHLLLAGLGINEGDEVIVPDCTWIASAAPITYLKAKTVFVDIDSEHWCIDPNALEAAITSNTKAVIVVDLFGNMPDMDKIKEITERHGIYLIEDAAEAIGSMYKGVKAGKFGVGSVFSFHRTKTLTTGEGGMLLLDDINLYERCKFLRDHGRAPGTYYNTEVTFKYMPSNLLAALGYAQFQRIHELVERKRWIWKKYQEILSDIDDIYLNPEPSHVYNGVWCTALVFGKSYNLKKEQAMAELEKLGLPSRPFFYPLTSLPAYENHFIEGKQNNPIAYDISARGINLPCAFTLNQEKIERYCEGIRHVLNLAS